MPTDNDPNSNNFPPLKWLWFTLAWLSFVIGIIGAFLPILPTTPFLILSAFLFSKSSPKFHAWIMSLPMAGEAVRDWQQNRVINTRAKILCASMILLSFVLIWRSEKIPLVIQILVTVTLASVGTFVVTRKGRPKE
jgi:uncharacterized membrane protein YbaN (DUF454 family)